MEEESHGLKTRFSIKLVTQGGGSGGGRKEKNQQQEMTKKGMMDYKFCHTDWVLP
jgi:hypothetical protein